MVDIFSHAYACNTYMMWNENKDAFIVDPGTNISNCLLNHIAKLGLNIVAILISHGHCDHIGGLEDVIKAFPNSITYMCEDELAVLENPRYNLSLECEKELTFVPNNLKLLSDGEEIDVIGKKIKMIKTPFHTIGSACFYIKEENILFSGDTLFHLSIGRCDLPSGSYRTIDSSLRKLITLPKETKIYPGHESITTMENELKFNTYLKNL